QVSSSVCIRSFRWLQPVAGDASFLSLHDLSVNKTTFIDIGSNADRHDQTSDRTHKFEAIGLETHSLIFNFAKAASYANWVNGIKFEHVYTAENITCGYNPSFADADADSKTKSKSLLETGRGDGATLHLPRADEVVAWLNLNSIATTQPSEAFVAAFQKEGEADSAKEVRIARAARELAATWERVSKEFHDLISRPLGTQPTSSSVIATSPNVRSSISDLAVDGVAAVFGSLLSHVADYGYRPEKVIWIFVGTIFGSLLYFWLRLRVVA